jgi:hypothetical protein
VVKAAALPLPLYGLPSVFLSCIRMLGWVVCIRFNVEYGTVACVALKRGGASIHDAAPCRCTCAWYALHVSLSSLPSVYETVGTYMAPAPMRRYSTLPP